MAQIFHPSTNTFSKVSIFGALFLVGGLLWMLSVVNRSSYVTQADVAREQPVPFSHKHHVGELGIDCRYCHTSVEVSSSANIPPTQTCMNCHAQIWSDSPTLEPVRASYRTGESIEWVKVHDLPDFVYFNHSIHVNKGIGCVSCHGRVDEMNLIYQVAIAPDGVVSGMPPQPGAARSSTRRSLQHGVVHRRPTGARRPARR